MRCRWSVMVLTVVAASLLCTRGVEAAWAVITTDGASSFAAGRIAAPGALTVTHGTGPSANRLSWTLPPASQQGSGQTVSSSIDGGAYTTVATLPGAAVAATDSPVVGDTTYCYLVTTTYARWTASTAPACVGPFAPLGAVNAGGGAVGNYMGDVLYSGGTTSSTAAAIDTSGVANPAPQAVYQSQRLGNFTYAAGGLTPNAVYQVRLQEAELSWSSAGQRTFNVKINGVQVMTNYDIFQASGGKDRAIALSFSTTADASGAIAVQFISVKDRATVCGLELL